MKRFQVLLTAVLLTIFVGQVYAASTEGDHVIATVGSRRITQHEVDLKLKTELAAVENQLYELRRRAAQSIADDYLIEQAAKKADLSVPAYLKREIDDKAKPPTEADAKKFYDDHKAQISQPYDKIKEQLIAFMKNQQTGQLRNDLMEKLRAGEPVKIMMKPPRFSLATAGHPELGSNEAPVTIAEFADFQCPFCKRTEDTLKRVRTKYGDKVRVVHLDFPLSIHAHALQAAEAARCAGEQGKFWPYHDALYADQGKLAPEDLKASAARLGLDKNQFDACLDNAKYESGVRKDQAQGTSLGVEGTPAFFINGRSLSGAVPLERFSEIIDEELASAGHREAKAEQ
jgi:protein-disulfide isomerase